MESNIELINGLKDIGLTERQAKVYRTLLTLQDASLTDLYQKSGVPQNRISEIVRTLVEMGLCSEKKINKRKYYNLLKPENSMNPLLQEMENRLEQNRSFVKNLTNMFNHKGVRSEPLEHIEIVQGNKNIHEFFCKILAETKTEMLSFIKAPWAATTDNEDKEQGDLLQTFLENGGVVKGLYEINENSGQIKEIIKRDKKRGEKCKFSNVLPIKMFIFDRKLLLLTDVSDLSGELKMVLIKQQVMINAFIALFDFFWMQSND